MIGGHSGWGSTPKCGQGLSGGSAPSVRVLPGGGLLKIMTGSVRCSGDNLAPEGLRFLHTSDYPYQPKRPSLVRWQVMSLLKCLFGYFFKKMKIISPFRCKKLKIMYFQMSSN